MTFLMRWNPSISSFTLDLYRSILEQCDQNGSVGFFLDWSIYEHDQAAEGDQYYMLRLGDDHAGVVFRGSFLSDPYPGEDWAGKGRSRYYVDMTAVHPVGADDPARIPIERLQQALPAIDWTRGHSGVLLTSDQTAVLDALWAEAFAED